MQISENDEPTSEKTDSHEMPHFLWYSEYRDRGKFKKIDNPVSRIMVDSKTRLEGQIEAC